MKIVKRTSEYAIYEKRNGRYAMKNAKGVYVTGDDKVKVLMDEGLLKRPEPKPAEPEAEAAEAEAAAE